MTSLYTKSSHNTPEGLTKPSSSFKKHVWLSVLGLLFFVIVYAVLIIWFARLTYYSFAKGSNFLNYLLGGGYAFLCLFMIKSLFIFNKREKSSLDKYITKEEEPLLFDYLYKLSDEAGAPRPKKVFLSPRVNASVSYDLSIINLIIPSKKNLEIGLGLMNVLSLGEFKAVLAHEFGHFAQRSMLLGRYVYIAQQIAVKIINKRDIFDKFLALISGIDIRIAWIGWILSILVWAVRSLIETCFSIVTIAQRALSREMEFQADLVAVSLTGSDALIHALSKLQVADEAYNHAIEVINNKLDDGKAVENLYTLQSNQIEKKSWILDEPTYGKSPKIATVNPESDRIFGKRAFNPPQMWSTHPADKDREENTKKIYIQAEIDNRPAEDLLSDPKKYEIEMTAKLVATSGVKTEVLPDEESLTFQNKKYFNWTFLDPKYRSNFLNRFFTINFKNVEDLYDQDIDKNRIVSSFESMYSHELTNKLEALKEVKEEIADLELRLSEVITIEKREIWHRGNRIKRKDLKEIIKSLKQEEVSLLGKLNDHDIQCRITNYKAAQSINNEWADYLRKICGLVHYSEHATADIQDASVKYNNVVSIAFADGKITSTELTSIINAGHDYYKSVKSAFYESKNIQLNKALLQNSNKEVYSDFFEEFKLPPPTRENIDDWAKVIDDWANSALIGLNFLRNSSLEHLLDIEENIKEAYLHNKPMPSDKPDSIKTISSYKLLTPGTERLIQSKLGLWDRFMVGDGFWGATAKFGVSVFLIGGVLLLGSFSQLGQLTVYNGLDLPVIVSIDGNEELSIPANIEKSISLDYDTSYDIVTIDFNGKEIERFTERIGAPGKEYIYNIANAGVFLEYTVYYDNNVGSIPENKNIGASRWFNTKADYVLETPPEEDKMGTWKDVIVAYSDISPYDMISIVNDSTELKNLIHSHIAWDSPQNENILNWVNLLAYSDNAQDALDQRIKNLGNDMISKRAKMDFANDDQKKAICNEIKNSSTQNPNNADLYYLNTRCLGDSDYQDDVFVKGYEKWKDHPWLAYASAYIYAKDEQWTSSLRAFNTASQVKSLKNSIALDAEKVRRMASSTSSKEELDFTSSNLEYYLSIENKLLNKASGDPNYVHIIIAKGQLKEAYDFINDYENYKSYILRFLAVSEGVSNEIIEEVKLLNDEEGLDRSSTWWALTFNILHNKDYSNHIDTLETIGISPLDVNAFIDSVKSGNYNTAENIIKKQLSYFKGYMYMMGYIISKYEAPIKWKNRADKLLLTHEKPFIK